MCLVRSMVHWEGVVRFMVWEGGGMLNPNCTDSSSSTLLITGVIHRVRINVMCSKVHTLYNSMVLLHKDFLMFEYF